MASCWAVLLLATLLWLVQPNDLEASWRFLPGWAGVSHHTRRCLRCYKYDRGLQEHLVFCYCNSLLPFAREIYRLMLIKPATG